MMEIVIEIPDKLYEYIVKGRDLSEEQNDEMALAIADGIPLPKGHGRLVDADWVKNTLDIYVIREYDGQFIRRKDIDSVPTIIEADKESDNK